LLSVKLWPASTPVTDPCSRSGGLRSSTTTTICRNWLAMAAILIDCLTRPCKTSLQPDKSNKLSSTKINIVLAGNGRDWARKAFSCGKNKSRCYSLSGSMLGTYFVVLRNSCQVGSSQGPKVYRLETVSDSANTVRSRTGL
jgi:hypothetical protein